MVGVRSFSFLVVPYYTRNTVLDSSMIRSELLRRRFKLSNWPLGHLMSTSNPSGNRYQVDSESLYSIFSFPLLS